MYCFPEMILKLKTIFGHKNMIKNKIDGFEIKKKKILVWGFLTREINHLNQCEMREEPILDASGHNLKCVRAQSVMCQVSTRGSPG